MKTTRTIARAIATTLIVAVPALAAADVSKDYGDMDYIASPPVTADLTEGANENDQRIVGFHETVLDDTGCVTLTEAVNVDAEPSVAPDGTFEMTVYSNSPIVTTPNQNQYVATPLPAAGTHSIPAGTRVRSYYIHSDPVWVSPLPGVPQKRVDYVGGLRFDEEVLGVVSRTATLDQQSQAQLQRPNYTYPLQKHHGLELENGGRDSFSIDGYKVFFYSSTASEVDQARIITRCDS